MIIFAASIYRPIIKCILIICIYSYISFWTCRCRLNIIVIIISKCMNLFYLSVYATISCTHIGEQNLVFIRDFVLIVI